MVSRWLIDRPLHQFSICGNTAESWAVLCCWSLIKGVKAECNCRPIDVVVNGSVF